MTGELLVSFTVWGEPLPKQRPKFGKGRAYTPKKTRDAETAVIDAFDHACPLWDACTDDLVVEADFYRKGQRLVDGDNLFKLVTDALNKIVYLDDSQITDGHFRRFLGAGDKARTEVRIYLAGQQVTS